MAGEFENENRNYKCDAKKEVTSALDLIDVWRFIKQEQIRYTWFIWSNHLIAVSDADYWLIINKI